MEDTGQDEKQNSLANIFCCCGTAPKKTFTEIGERSNLTDQSLASNIHAGNKGTKRNYKTITEDTVVNQPSLMHTTSRTSEDSITSVSSGNSSSNTSDGQRDTIFDQKEINNGSLFQTIMTALETSQKVGYYGKTCLGIEFANQRYVFKQWNHQIVLNAKQSLDEGSSVLSRLQHGNVIRILGFYKEFNGVLEECGVESLSDRMIVSDNKRILDCFQRHKILCDVVEGLGYLHSNSIVHNNLTGNNIILTKDNIAKITHGGYYTVFPKARAAVKADGYKDFRQKLGYFSSRALGGIAEVANDIFSLGAVILLIVSGKEPYADNEDYIFARFLLEDSSKWNKLKDDRIMWVKRRSQFSNKTYRKSLLKIAKDCMRDKMSDRPTLNKVKGKLVRYKATYFTNDHSIPNVKVEDSVDEKGDDSDASSAAF